MCWQEMVHALREELTLKENALEEMKKAVKEVSHLMKPKTSSKRHSLLSSCLIMHLVYLPPAAPPPPQKNGITISC